MGLLDTLNTTVDPFSNISIPKGTGRGELENVKGDKKPVTTKRGGQGKGPMGGRRRGASGAGKGTKRKSANPSSDSEASGADDMDDGEFAAAAEARPGSKLSLHAQDSGAGSMLALAPTLQQKYMDLGSDVAVNMNAAFSNTATMMGKQKQQIEFRRKELWQALEQQLSKEKADRVQELGTIQEDVKGKMTARVAEVQQMVQSSGKELVKYQQELQRKLNSKVNQHKKLVNDCVQQLQQDYEAAAAALQQQAERVGQSYKEHAEGMIATTGQELKALDAKRAKMAALNEQFAALAKQLMEANYDEE